MHLQWSGDARPEDHVFAMVGRCPFGPPPFEAPRAWLAPLGFEWELYSLNLFVEFEIQRIDSTSRSPSDAQKQSLLQSYQKTCPTFEDVCFQNLRTFTLNIQGCLFVVCFKK